MLEFVWGDFSASVSEELSLSHDCDVQMSFSQVMLVL